MIHAFWNLQVRNTKNKPLLKGTRMFTSEQTTSSVWRQYIECEWRQRLGMKEMIIV